MKNFSQWEGFKGNRWKEKIDVRNFISMNYTPYDGDASFLEEPTEATNKLWGKLQELQKEERAKGGVLDMETEVVTSLTAYGPGYIDEDLKDLETVVGLQTDKPLKRAFMPYGGIKMAEQACETYGYKVSDKIKDVFHNYEFKTHNQGVFDIYTPEMKKARPVLIVVIIAIILSCLFYYIPLLSKISSGITITIVAITAAIIGSIFFPVSDEADNSNN